ncbi:hypothetical protein BWZ43_21385, partial [Heyndrickxia oleronia]
LSFKHIPAAPNHFSIFIPPQKKRYCITSSFLGEFLLSISRLFGRIRKKELKKSPSHSIEDNSYLTNAPFCLSTFLHKMTSFITGMLSRYQHKKEVVHKQTASV